LSFSEVSLTKNSYVAVAIYSSEIKDVLHIFLKYGKIFFLNYRLF